MPRRTRGHAGAGEKLLSVTRRSRSCDVDTRERRLNITLQWSPHYPEQTSTPVGTTRGNFSEKPGTGNWGAPNFRDRTSLKHSAPAAPLETFAQTSIPRAGRNSLRDNRPAKFGAPRIPVPRFSEIEASTVAPSAQSRGSRNARRRPLPRHPYHPPWTRPRTRRHGLRLSQALRTEMP